MEGFQIKDFYEIFKSFDGKPVCIRLLDPPLHEFLPSIDDDKEISELSAKLVINSDECIKRIKNVQESNSMLGFRGCRISIIHPEITTMQTNAIISAAIEAQREGVTVFPEILIPLVCTDHGNQNI
jgi:pyruvate,orthophosphate dikinase